jgi:hypothetical protein
MSDPNTLAEGPVAPVTKETGQEATEAVRPVKQLAKFLRTVATVVGIDHLLRIISNRESLDEAAKAQNVPSDELAALRAQRTALTAPPEKAAA